MSKAKLLTNIFPSLNLFLLPPSWSHWNFSWCWGQMDCCNSSSLPSYKSWPLLITYRATVCCAMLRHFSCVWLCDPWTVARQALLSLGFSRQKYCSALPCPPPGDLPDSGTEPTSLMFPALAGGFIITSAIWGAFRVALSCGWVRAGVPRLQHWTVAS